jgi:K+-transporting ATPase ATPase C chain
MRELKPAFLMTILMAVLTGLVYPFVVTGLAQVLFPQQSNGSLVRVGGRLVGSELIGQEFTRPEYFHPRPSAAGKGYDPTQSGASNLGPTNQKLLAAVAVNVKNAGGSPSHPVPADLATASGSGLDPDISVAAALFQVPRVAAARHIRPERLRQLVLSTVEPRQFDVFGVPRINVLDLNMALMQTR